MVQLIYDPAAKRETQEAAAWYESQQEGLERDFLMPLERAALTIQQAPERWRRIQGEYCRCLVKKFPYGIIYRVSGNTAFVAAVMHLKRKPGHWLD